MKKVYTKTFQDPVKGFFGQFAFTDFANERGVQLSPG
jgi:hypothetical protein